MNTRLIITLLIFVSSSLMGGDESLKRLEENRVYVFADDFAVSVNVEREQEGTYKIVAKIRGESINVPKKELAMFQLLHMRTISLNSYYDGAGNISKDKPIRSLVVGVKYGGSFQHGSETAPVVVYSYLKLYFDGGKFKGWRSAEPQGKFRNKWIIRDKNVDGEIETSEPVEMIHCPITPQGSD